MDINQQLKDIENQINQNAQTTSELNIMLEGILNLVRSLMSSCILVNGGALVAILAFLGNHVANNALTSINRELLSNGIKFFIFGLISALLLGAFSCLAQLIIRENCNRKTWLNIVAHILRACAIMSIIASITFFAYGSIDSTNALLQ